MNEPITARQRSALGPPLASDGPGNAGANVRPDVPRKPPVEPTRKPPTPFKFPAGTPEGDEERRDAERKRKAAARAVAARMVEPPPLPSAAQAVSHQAQAPLPGETPLDAPEVAPVLVPWTPEDIAEFTDELVELSEAKRISDFVALAREANLPPRLIAEIEKTSGYGTKTKAGLKRSVAVCAAKWLNKIGISARNREEAALLFFVITVKMQGFRLSSKLNGLIEEETKRRTAEKAKQNDSNQISKTASVAL